MKTILILLAFLCLIVSCKTPPGVERVYRIYIKNNSNKLVSYLTSNNYPDTTIPNQYNSLSGIPSTENAMLDSKRPCRDVIADLPVDTISIMLFDPDTISRYGWETVRYEHKVLKRWDVGVDYLEQRNWTLTFPE